jgi:hypothetical protein
MNIITIYNYYILLNHIICGITILNYTYKTYKITKKVKNFIFKEKQDKDWTIIN